MKLTKKEKVDLLVKICQRGPWEGNKEDFMSECLENWPTRFTDLYPADMETVIDYGIEVLTAQNIPLPAECEQPDHVVEGRYISIWKNGGVIPDPEKKKPYDLHAIPSWAKKKGDALPPWAKKKGDALPTWATNIKAITAMSASEFIQHCNSVEMSHEPALANPRIIVNGQKITLDLAHIDILLTMPLSVLAGHIVLDVPEDIQITSAARYDDVAYVKNLLMKVKGAMPDHVS
jgi:hypothetical protein